MYIVIKPISRSFEGDEKQKGKPRRKVRRQIDRQRDTTAECRLELSSRPQVHLSAFSPTRWSITRDRQHLRIKILLSTHVCNYIYFYMNIRLRAADRQPSETLLALGIHGLKWRSLQCPAHGHRQGYRKRHVYTSIQTRRYVTCTCVRRCL